jgi:hypothetical protein
MHPSHCNQRRASYLARPDYLPVVDEEDANLCHWQQLVDLRESGPIVGSGKPVLAGRADSVCFIKYERMELVRGNVALLVEIEIFEECRGARAHHLLHVLGKRLGAGQVEDVQACASQRPDQLQRDD